MNQSIRERSEKREEDYLSPLAALASRTHGRIEPEDHDSIRTAYQRDRDRILHSKAFRRLKHKTQVFIDPRGDHYRTRLTHTLEVAQVARTIGRALSLNEDLIEAIALAHDVGHTPFGHTGEQALDEVLRSGSHIDGPKEFSHSEQSLRIVDVLEPLNLTLETRQGIAGHSKGRSDLSHADGEVKSTLEAAVVRISDRIAYLASDIDDAFRAEIITALPSEYAVLGDRQSQRIRTLVENVIEQSLDRPSIQFSDDLLALLNNLKEFMFVEVYHKYPVKFPDISKAKTMVAELFHHFCSSGDLPQGYVGTQGAVDYVAGMTDRFALDEFVRLRLPESWRFR